MAKPTIRELLDYTGQDPAFDPYRRLLAERVEAVLRLRDKTIADLQLLRKAYEADPRELQNYCVQMGVAEGLNQVVRALDGEVSR